MSCIKTKTGENTITFDAFYQYIWARNYGDTDVYISNHSDIVAGDDDVALLPAGEAVRLTVNGKTLYVLGSTTLEVHAQNYSDSPFAWNEAGEGGGSDVSVVSLSVGENGTYTAPSGTAYSPVTVNVSDIPAVIESITINENGTYTAPSGVDGYSPVVVNVSPSLPDTYEEIDYVGISGYVGFDIPNYVSNVNDVIDIESSTDTLSGSQGFFGSRGNYELYYESGSLMTWGTPIVDLIGTRAIEANVKYPSKAKFVAVGYPASFGFYSYSDYFFYGKLYSCSISRPIVDQSGTQIELRKIIDLIPVKRKSDNKIGMYDLVNQIFCVSTTGTDFTAPSE